VTIGSVLALTENSSCKADVPTELLTVVLRAKVGVHMFNCARHFLRSSGSEMRSNQPHDN
jgi:hypothetical protein